MTDTPDASFTNGLHGVQLLIALLAGGAASGLLGGAEAGAAGLSGAIDPALLESISGAIPAGAETALTGAPEILGPGAASGLTGGASAGIDPSLLGEVSGAIPTTPGTPLTPSPEILGPPGGGPGFLSSNAGNLARLGLAGASALGANRTGGASGPGGNSSGGMGDPNSIIEAMANANRVNQTTPFGSRNWSQGADGRWSVADTLSAPEQANLTNVQGMNADVTKMAMQRLATLMAQQPRARADRPLMFNGQSIGG